MNLKQLKELLSICQKTEVKEIMFGKVHVQFHNKGDPEPDQEQVVIQALGGSVVCQDDEDHLEE